MSLPQPWTMLGWHEARGDEPRGQCSLTAALGELEDWCRSWIEGRMAYLTGNVDVAGSLIQQEYRIAVLERVVDLLIQRFPRIGSVISESEMAAIRASVVAELQR